MSIDIINIETCITSNGFDIILAYGDNDLLS